MVRGWDGMGWDIGAGTTEDVPNMTYGALEGHSAALQSAAVAKAHAAPAGAGGKGEGAGAGDGGCGGGAGGDGEGGGGGAGGDGGDGGDGGSGSDGPQWLKNRSPTGVRPPNGSKRELAQASLGEGM